MKTEVYPKVKSDIALSRPLLAQLSLAWLAPVVLLAAMAAFHLFTLSAYPAPFWDEGWNAARSWALLQTGHAFGILDAGVLDKYDGYWTFFPWLGAAIHAPAIQLFGLSLFSMRLTSLVFGLALLAIIYVIANRLSGPRAALFAVLLVSLSHAFLISSHMARHDVVIAVLGYGAIALYVTGGASPSALLVKSTLAGLAIGLAVDVHPNSIIYGPVILALFLLDYGWSVVRRARFWGFALGACAGVVYYAVMHILPYPQTYSALTNLCFGPGRTPPLLTLDPGEWIKSIEHTFILAGLWWLPLMVVAYVTLLRSPRDSDKRILVLFSVLLLTFMAVIRIKYHHYSILIIPGALLLVAAFLGKLSMEPLRGSLKAFTRTIVVWSLVGTAVVLSVLLVFKWPEDEYPGVFDRIRQAIPSQSSLIASQTYWFAMPDQRYLSWDQLAYYRFHAPGSTVEDAFRDLKPEYLIMDNRTESSLTDNEALLTQSGNTSYVPKSEMEQFMAGHTRLVAEFSTSAFGDIRIYEVKWD